LLASAADDHVLFLSGTYPGATNDKRIADEEQPALSAGTNPVQKTRGFQGYEPAVQRPARRKKKPRGRALTAAEKGANRQLAKVARARGAMPSPGVKRSRIVKDVFRNKKPEVSDASMEAACGLHNLRVKHRKTALKKLSVTISENV